MENKQTYISPSTPDFKHSIDNYLAEVLLIKKYPDAINQKFCWKDTKYTNDFVIFQQSAILISKYYPTHFIIDVVVHSNIQDFTPNGLIVFVSKKVDEWVKKNNNHLLEWSNKRKIANRVIENSGLTVTETKRKTFKKLRF